VSTTKEDESGEEREAITGRLRDRDDLRKKVEKGDVGVGGLESTRVVAGEPRGSSGGSSSPGRWRERTGGTSWTVRGAGLVRRREIPKPTMAREMDGPCA
jgi:hypothetical protein